MRATGIVRRVDDLGRVVIPKEIRKTMRIKEGDPLELFTTKDGEIVFKKYSYADEHDWVKAKYLVRAIFPNLQFGLYDDLGEMKTATNCSFYNSIDIDDNSYDNNVIVNNEMDTIGYIVVSDNILASELDKICKLLKEFFSDNL